MTQQYWQWPESTWISPDTSWKNAKLITAGVDVGAVSTQAVVMCDGSLYCYASIYTTAESGGSGAKALQMALNKTGMSVVDIQYTVGTGYGRKNVASAQKTLNEITCHLRGAGFMFGPTVRTVIDMGGQGVKVLKCTAEGRMTEFYANDKCSTGLGRGIERLSRLSHVPLEKMGEISLSVEKDPEPVSTTCYLFANTEAMGLFREGAKESEMLAGYLFAIAYRIYGLAGRLKPEKELALTGGIAKNSGIVKRLERELGMSALTSQWDPQLAGAIGAALEAQDEIQRVQKAMAGVN